MKRWVGRWIILVGVIHCVFGAVIFFEPLSEMVRSGFWNAVDGYPGRPLAFWFEFTGMLTILFGVTVDQIEQDRNTFPVILIYGFGFMTLLAIFTMPIGGGWLMVPGAVGLFLKKAKALEQIRP